MKRALIVGLVVLVLLAVGGLLLFAGGVSIMHSSARRSLTSGIHVGMPRSQVIAVKGQPDRVAYSLKDAQTPSHYRPAPSKPVEKEVLIYHRFVYRMYVYIGHDGRVTDIHLAQT